MHLASTGKINTTNILVGVELLSKEFTATSLPVCVDFDHVFDINNPSRCIARSNIENPSENLFYIVNPMQSVLNQVEAGMISEGKYFSLLPCRSHELESSSSYSNNLVLCAFIISKNNPTADLANIVKTVYDAMGIKYMISVCEDIPNCVEFIVNGITVCRVETKYKEDKYVTTASVITEPVLSYTLSLV